MKFRKLLIPLVMLISSSCFLTEDDSPNFTEEDLEKDKDVVREILAVNNIDDSVDNYILTRNNRVFYLKFRLIEMNEGDTIKTIPSEIAKLTYLENFYITGHPITSLPEEFWDLSNLNCLGINYTQIDTVPSEIKKLEKLSFFEISSINMKTIQEEIAYLPNLNQLWISAYIDSLPLCFKNSSITQFSSDFSNLKKIPEAFFEMKNLDHINIQNAELGVISDDILKIQKLSGLHLRACKIDSISPAIGQLDLVKLSLNMNNLTTLPDDIVNLGEMLDLDVSSNRLKNVSDTVKAWLDKNDPDWEKFQKE